jgi:hypothetical protein
MLPALSDAVGVEEEVGKEDQVREVDDEGEVG